MNTNGFSAAFFLQQTDAIISMALFQNFAHYLLDTTGICQFPVSLDRIRNKHNFNIKTASLPQRGFFFQGMIFINGDDLDTVQRFTEAHEMMESLVVALRNESPTRIPPFKEKEFERDKEAWCEQGAAELLMPGDLFFPQFKLQGISLNGGRRMAKLCQTSLTATVRRMLDSDISPCIFAILREGHKKKQIVPSKIGQGVLWGNPTDWDPPAELRVWRRWISPQVKRFLCKNESFSRESSIYQTLKSGVVGELKTTQENLDLEKIKGLFLIETMLVAIEKVPSVMIMIHL